MNGFDSPRRAAAAAALQAATVNIAQAISVHEFPGVQVAKEIKVDLMNPPPLVPVVPVAMPLTTCFANQVCHHFVQVCGVKKDNGYLHSMWRG